MANRNFPSAGKIYSGHVMPVLIDCNFIVDATDSAGLGIRSLKGPYVSAVYMHTSATPATGSPNPASGTIVVQLTDNFNRMYAELDSRISPNSGTPVAAGASAMTVGVAYTITVLGTTTTAQWHTLGVPAGVTPAVGVAFIAAATGAGSGSGFVQAAAATGTGVASIELVGNPNLSIAPDPTANQGYGASFILQCRDYAGALVAPADGSTISLSFYLSNSSILIAGE